MMKKVEFVGPVTIRERKNLDLQNPKVKFIKVDDMDSHHYEPESNPFSYYDFLGKKVFGPFYQGNKLNGYKIYDLYETSQYRDEHTENFKFGDR